ncbi:MAG: hypothetical protein ACRDZO_06325 [Egibacteraceae bacterium]
MSDVDDPRQFVAAPQKDLSFKDVSHNSYTRADPSLADVVGIVVPLVEALERVHVSGWRGCRVGRPATRGCRHGDRQGADEQHLTVLDTHNFSVNFLTS